MLRCGLWEVLRAMWRRLAERDSTRRRLKHVSQCKDQRAGSPHLPPTGHASYLISFDPSPTRWCHIQECDSTSFVCAIASGGLCAMRNGSHTFGEPANSRGRPILATSSQPSDAILILPNRPPEPRAVVSPPSTRYIMEKDSLLRQYQGPRGGLAVVVAVVGQVRCS
jgi:hypothetical protein